MVHAGLQHQLLLSSCMVPNPVSATLVQHALLSLSIASYLGRALIVPYSA